MAISVDWATKVITVPKADLTLVQASPEIRSLDLDWFRLSLKDLEDDEQGITYLDTHRHVAPITVGGLALGRVVEIINGYTVTFEDGAYRADALGANSNLLDVVNYNSVQVTTQNSAGLANVSVNGGGLTDIERTMLYELYRLAGLDAGHPVTIPAGAGTIAATDIDISVIGDCDTGHTLTRNP